MPQPKVFNKATGQWVHHAAITDPTGGTTTDTQGRTAVVSILAALRSAGVIAGATHLNVGHKWNATLRKVVLGPAITDPTGGTPDAAGRTAIGSVLTVLRKTGIIAGGTSGPAFVLDATEHQWAAGAAIADLAVDGSGDDQMRTALNAALAAMRDAELIA